MAPEKPPQSPRTDAQTFVEMHSRPAGHVVVQAMPIDPHAATSTSGRAVVASAGAPESLHAASSTMKASRRVMRAS